MGINVMSLCDGMACLMQALERENIKVENYFASEIYEPAMKVSNRNYKDIKQIGDLTSITKEFIAKLPKIDLLGFGFPCKGLSITNLNNFKQGLKEKQSILFYDCINILNWIRKYNNPNVIFLCENVASMAKSEKEIITKTLCIEPWVFDSNTVTAQDRKRYYWTNIKGVERPKYDNIVLKDIIELAENVPLKYWYDKPFIFNGEDKKIIATLELNGHDIMKRVYNINGKCGTLTSCRGGNLQKKIFQDGRCRKLMPIEYERLQGVKDGYTDCVADTHRYNMLGDGWTIDIIAHILSFAKFDK